MISNSAPDSDYSTLMDFLELPLNSSDGVFEIFNAIPNGMALGTSPERFFYSSGYRDNKVLLVAHADSFWDSTECPQHKVIESDGVLRSSSPLVGMGADNRAGCAIIWLLRNMGHSILITDGEEQGLIGSRFLADNYPDLADEIQNEHQFVIEFDRCNGTDYKTYYVGSPSFREFIERTTGYVEADKWSCTDIVQLCTVICGVNLSIGYRDEHTVFETLNLDEWRNTLSICRTWLSNPMLPRFEVEEEPFDWKGDYWF